MLHDLSDTLAKASRCATFACGGSIPIVEPNVDKKGNLTSNSREAIKSSLITKKHVTIRYGPSGKGKSLTLPTDDKQRSAIKALIQACQPANFGMRGKDVLDETYRKASKLDATDFCTDFCPYEAGIIDIVTQSLLPPTVEQSIDEQRNRQGVRAELYKLNVYSAPSGHFKAHVDTPRGSDQIGSLVVSLPVDFEGLCHLNVAHSMTYADRY